MDFVYGEINEKVQQNTYRGIPSNTAQVLVDNTNNTIQVIAHSDTTGVNELINEALSNIKGTFNIPTGYVVSGISQNNGFIYVTFRKITSEDITVDLSASQINGLSSVATSGNYDDLTNKPEIIYNDENHYLQF